LASGGFSCGAADDDDKSEALAVRPTACRRTRCFERARLQRGYDGAGHGFFNYYEPRYRQQAAMDGWDKVEELFAQHL
jgi:carboxymethylenebutenolidase